MRLLIVDIDGTLTVGEDVPHRTRDAFARLRAAGWETMIATGRPWSLARSHAEAIGVARRAIVCNGARVVDAAGRVLHSSPMDDELAARVLRHVWRLPAEIQLMGVDGFSCRPGDDDTRRFYGSAGPLRLLDEPDLPERILCVGLWARPELRDELDRDLRDRFGAEADICAGGPCSIDVLAKGVSKGSALDWVLRDLGERPERVVAAGDHGNDLELLRRADVAAAPIDASPDVLREADVVYPPAGTEGICELIERLLEERPLKEEI
ncbi:MAG: HAD family phosphatase [Synergistaceae bacterium]|nr:HAD family phosphatase [Synergistaceae bacterium]